MPSSSKVRARATRWLARHGLVLATGVAAGVPIVASAIQALDDGWTPIGDNAVIALRAFDVLSAHPPLLGQYSLASVPEVGPVYSPGPLLYWLLAPGARLSASAGLLLTIALVNLASVMGTVALARRRGGVLLMFAVALGLVATCRALPASALYDPWNPYAPLLPLTLLAFLAWSVACGEARLLPVAVLVASFAMQSHLSFVMPALGLLLIATVGLVLQHRAARRWVTAASVVAVVCWAPPIVDQIVHQPGNVVALARTSMSDRPSGGIETGWHVVARALGAVPLWLERPTDDVQLFFELVARPRPLRAISALLVVAALVAVIALELRRRRTEPAVGAGIALFLLSSLLVVAAATPAASAGNLAYTVLWGVPVSMLAWVIAVVGLIAAVRAGRRDAGGARSHAGVSHGRWHEGIGLALVLAAGVGTAAAPAQDESTVEYDAARRAAAAAEALSPAQAVQVLAAPSRGTFDKLHFDLSPAVGYALRRRGVRVLMPPGFFTTALGSHYDGTGQPHDAGVLVETEVRGVPPDRRMRVVDRIPVSLPSGREYAVISFGPGGDGGQP